MGQGLGDPVLLLLMRDDGELVLSTKADLLDVRSIRSATAFQSATVRSELVVLTLFIAKPELCVRSIFPCLKGPHSDTIRQLELNR